MTAEEKKSAEEKRARRSDALYFSGAVLITAGIAAFNWKLGIISAGQFCIALPALEIISGFIRGLRTK